MVPTAMATKDNAKDTIKAGMDLEIPMAATGQATNLNVVTIQTTTPPGEAIHVGNQAMEITTDISAMRTQMAQTIVATSPTIGMVMSMVTAMDLIAATQTTPTIKTIEKTIIGTPTIAVMIATTIISAHRNSTILPTCRIPTQPLALTVIIRHSRPDGFRQRLVRENPTISICLVSTNRAAAQVALGIPMAGSAMMAILETRRSLSHEVRIYVTLILIHI